MMTRTFFVILALWTLLLGPGLCAAGLLGHVCSDCPAEEPAHHETDDAAADDACGHEADCDDDRCEDDLLRPWEGAPQNLNLALVPIPPLVRPANTEPPIAPRNHIAVTSLAGKRLPHLESDRPLLI